MGCEVFGSAWYIVLGQRLGGIGFSRCEIGRRWNRTSRASENSEETRHASAARHRSGDLCHRTAHRLKPMLPL
jgi:hypothetical protein